MKVYKCDRCGKVIESIDGMKDNRDGSPSISVFYNQRESYADICNECYRDFHTWMDMGKPLATQNSPNKCVD